MTPKPMETTPAIRAVRVPTLTSLLVFSSLGIACQFAALSRPTRASTPSPFSPEQGG